MIVWAGSFFSLRTTMALSIATRFVIAIRHRLQGRPPVS